MQSDKLEIVKVQLPLYSAEAEPGILIYNKYRTRMAVITPTPELRELIGDAEVSYWWATWYPDPENKEHGTFELQGPAPRQSW